MYEGGKVYSLRFGDGIVSEIREPSPSGSAMFAVFHGAQRTVLYTLAGRAYEDDIHPDLYHGKPSIIAPPEPERRPQLELDAPILVRMNERDTWRHRHFYRWSNNSVVCWMNGSTSWSENKGPWTWPYWKLPEEGE